MMFAKVFKTRVTATIDAETRPPGYVPLTKTIPAHDPIIEEITGLTYIVGEAGVEAVYEVTLRVDAVDRAKRHKKTQIKQAALQNIQAIYPAIKDIETLALVRDILLSVVPAARNLTDDIQSVVDIYQTAKSDLSAVEALTDPHEIMSY